MSALVPHTLAAKQFVLGIYEHVKGNRYRVLTLARLEATLEEVVVYQSLDDPKECWVRPLQEFLARFKFVNG